MTNSNAKSVPVLVKGILAALTVATTVVIGSSASQAMVIHNCTDQGFNIRLDGKQGGPKPRAYVDAQSSKAIHSTKQFGPYRIVLPALGEGGWFSGRKWNGTYSLVRSGGGNIGLKNGNACAEFGPDPDEGGDIRSQNHIAYCYRKYRSYREWDNTFQPYGGGPRRECDSGLL